MRKVLTLLSILFIIILVGLLLNYQEDHPSTIFDDEGQISYDFEAYDKVENFKHHIALGLILSFGVMLLALPTSWMTFGERWKYNDAIEPSEIRIFLNRAIGALLLVIGFFYFLIQIISI
ncbi:MAG: hypothetical protein JXR88_05050 [Clostridia bacterium]|nr:hypothetical protein [Clostridia bacterium]